MIRQTQILRNRTSSRLFGIASVLATSASLSACGGEYETRYERPITVPENATYLGMSDNDEGAYSAGSGKSFLMHIEDTARVDCGKSKKIVPDGKDYDYNITKEIRVLSNGMAQVTCHGAFQEEFPVTTYPSQNNTVASGN